ncbi:4F2 cell-surface antigen heavy chain [Strigops habroptila]|uniref:Solute carrier family 3 member 2 n=1 Tax=Strigops habroptila TaxID=2489341 RepID=A0A672U5F0_STRHB|nr:4F2 cell-surface antigen heavy chain [Strigops habroptila]XP_030330360.1 4F2 cell-surface antigen heavy chain [Strigops habroptila]
MEADTESSPRDLELSALEAEKEPMAAAGEDPAAPPEPEPGAPGGEKNGLVKLPEELGLPMEAGGAKFTGLGKEELLRAAGTPPWAKARAVLLLLFWLGWLGMLGAAAAIVARAPRCRPLPPRSWWELGALYRAPPAAFAGDLKGVAARLEHVAGLQVKGLVLGPLHPQSSGLPQDTPLERLDPLLGSLPDLTHLLQAAKKKGLQVILDLTPNYLGGSAWFEPAVAEDPNFQDKVKRALSVWLERGVTSFFLDGIEELKPSVLAEWRNLTEQNSSDGVPRVLVGGTRLRDPPSLLALLNSSAVGLVLGPFLEALGPNPPGPTLAPQLLDFLRPKTPLAWSVGSPWQHLAGLSPLRAPQRLLLLWSLPGTPVLSYGDEVGLRDDDRGGPLGTPQPGQLTPMPWDLIEGIQEGDNSTEARLLELCRHLGALRVRERSLSLGDAEAIPADPAAAFLRSWDQSDRFLVVLNPGAQPLTELALQDPRLPPRATLRLSTHHPLPADPHVDLGALKLRPYEGLLLSFPYTP